MSRPLAGYSRQSKNQYSCNNATTQFKWYKPLGRFYCFFELAQEGGAFLASIF
jgi:hypothetical protein